MECPFCGIVFKKYEKMLEQNRSPAQLPAEGTMATNGSGPASHRKSITAAVIVVCVIGLLTFAFFNSDPEKRRKKEIKKFAAANLISIPGTYKSERFVRRGVCEDGCYFELVIDDNFTVISMSFDSRSRTRSRSHILWHHPSYVVATQTQYDFDSSNPPLYESWVIFDNQSISASSTRPYGDCVRDNIEFSFINQNIEPLPIETGRLHYDDSTHSLQAHFSYFIPACSGIKLSRDQFDPACDSATNLCRESYAKTMGRQWESYAMGKKVRCSFDFSIWPMITDFYIYPVSFFETVSTDGKRMQINIGESSEFFLSVKKLKLLGVDVFLRPDGSIYVEMDNGTIEHTLSKTG